MFNYETPGPRVSLFALQMFAAPLGNLVVGFIVALAVQNILNLNGA